MRTHLLLAASLSCCAAWAAADPLVLHPSEDTFLSAEHTGKPAGRGESKEFQVYGKPNDQQYRALLKFDLGEVKQAPGAAILRVYAWNIGRPEKTELVRCHPVLREWSQKHASWDRCLADDAWLHPGGDWDPVPVAGCNVTAQMGGEAGWWLDFDVTALVQAWVQKRRPNYGVVLMLDPDCKAEVRCRSLESDKPPELKLAWAAPLERGGGMVPGSKIKPYGKPPKMEPVWTTGGLNLARTGEAYQQKLAARGGARPYKFSAAGLPEGLKLAEDGMLSGTPAKEGRYPVVLTCAGADGLRATLRTELEVKAPAPAEAAAKKETSAPTKPAAGAKAQDEE